MAAAGYAGTELGDWGFLPTEPRALAADVGAARWRWSAAFVPVALAARRRDRRRASSARCGRATLLADAAPVR